MARLTKMRWAVQVRGDEFEDVGADRMKVLESGALYFTNGLLSEDVVIVYAPGQWLTVHPEDES